MKISTDLLQQHKYKAASQPLSNHQWMFPYDYKDDNDDDDDDTDNTEVSLV